jgi:hypothetical protein
MSDKITKAIRNNNDLYEAVFDPLGATSHRTNSIWYSMEKTPPLYSNLVTLAKNWQPDDVFRAINDNYEQEKWNKWSIKDSFGALDLGEFGFKKLFDAHWIYPDATNFATPEESQHLRYEIVESVDGLSKWRTVWDADERLGKEIFHPNLLDNPKVYFVAGYEAEKIKSGCFVNKSEDVLGVSNFFAPDDNLDYRSGMLDFILDSIERVDIVGYERNRLTENLRLLGFEAIEDLTVWLKKRASSFEE